MIICPVERVRSVERGLDLCRSVPPADEVDPFAEAHVWSVHSYAILQIYYPWSEPFLGEELLGPVLHVGFAAFY